MGARRKRLQTRLDDQRVSRVVNGHKKRKERERRQIRILELIKKGTYPWTPPIMSWVSAQLDKPSSRITQEDVDKLVSDLSA